MEESDSKRIFHFTKTIENLISIIKAKEFWVCYSLENFGFLNETDEFGYEIIESFAYPITCFCDIPLDKRILNHEKEYGVFGIGMTKHWAKEMGIAPVHYVPNYSIASKLWKSTLGGIDNIVNLSKEPSGAHDYFENLISLGTFIKPYENKEGKIFYNEREWRYYPPREAFGEKRVSRFLKREDFEKLKGVCL